ncbi:MAG TPA: hypothetical protein VJS64_18470 [Pyrinomonadaceae bacterium]|nr:hypothetical protein [Pyrinomonadaceae bacterium]
MKHHQRISTLQDLITVLFFGFAICLPTIGLVFRWHVMNEQDENRKLAGAPSIPSTREAIANFPAAFTAYFNDNFGFRPILIKSKARIELGVFGISPSPLVIVGKNGWWFHSSEYSATGTHLVPTLTAKQLEDWKKLLEGRRDWLAQRNIRYLFTIVPRKEVIYPEYLPDSFRPQEESRYEQLTTYLRKYSDVQILDLRPALYQAKARHLVHYKNDSHWNFYGGLAGYQVIITELNKTFPQMMLVTESDCGVRIERRESDLAKLVGLAGQISEDDPVLYLRQRSFSFTNSPITVVEKPARALATERKETNLPRLVVFDDSAGRALVPFLPQHFSRAVFVFISKLDPVLIEAEKPDIVIQEIGEMVLSTSTSPDLTELEDLKSGGKGRAIIKYVPTERR